MSEENEYTLRQVLRGVFSTDAMGTVGFGSTKRRVKQQIYVFAEETGPDWVSITPLNSNFIPSGGKSVISKEELLSRYHPEPDIYLTKVLPALRELEQTVTQADRCREAGMHFTAEFEYKNVLRVDENHIRATFGLGLTYLDRSDTHLAELVFCKLAKLGATFHPEQKHLFNEFGMKLRKNGMLTQALLHYARALRLSPTDEHLLYNIARVLYARGKNKATQAALNRALRFRPDFPEALGFKRHIEFGPGEILPDGKPVLDFTVDTFAELAPPTPKAPS